MINYDQMATHFMVRKPYIVALFGPPNSDLTHKMLNIIELMYIIGASVST